MDFLGSEIHHPRPCPWLQAPIAFSAALRLLVHGSHSILPVCLRVPKRAHRSCCVRASSSLVTSAATLLANRPHAPGRGGTSTRGTGGGDACQPEHRLRHGEQGGPLEPGVSGTSVACATRGTWSLVALVTCRTANPWAGSRARCAEETGEAPTLGLLAKTTTTRFL